MIEFGSHASFRITEHGQSPILKLAHLGELSTKLFLHEFKVIPNLTKLGLPVVEFDQQPILNNGVSCSCGMKRLFKLGPSELRSRADYIKQTLDRLQFCWPIRRCISVILPS